MRNITAEQITDKVRELILQASFHIGEDIYAAVGHAAQVEASPTGREVLSRLAENYHIAAAQNLAICQDTGMAIFFVELGQELHITDGDFEEAVNEGVRRAYSEGYLRKSVVSDPLYERKNTTDNTPAVIHTRIVPGDSLDITVTLKGFGSENMSGIAMLTPAHGEEGVVNYVLERVLAAGPNPCPPLVVGVGIGGTMEQAALLAKKATARPIDSHHPDMNYALLEEKLLIAINKLGIGPAGLGGLTTALGVNIEWAPTHIAGMPVAVNLCCHAARHAHAVL